MDILERFRSSLTVGDVVLQRGRWTRDVTRLSAVVIFAAALLIAAGTLAGIFYFSDTYIIYILLAAALLAWWAARRACDSPRRYWIWAALAPIATCFYLGWRGSYFDGFHSHFVLFYALTVILSGMLLGPAARWVALAASLAAFAYYGMAADGFSLDSLPSLIVFAFSLTTVALLQEYSTWRLGQALGAHILANQELQAEISRRHKAEDLLREQGAQFKRLAENMSDLVVELSLDGVMIYVSPSHRARLGYDPETLQGTNGFDLLHPDDRALALAVAQSAMDGREKKLEVRVRHAAGHYLTFEIIGRVLYAPNGNPMGFVLTSRDVTLQKQVETALQQSEQKFRGVIHALPLGAVICGLDPSGRLIVRDHNPAAEAILKRSACNLVGRAFDEVFPLLSDSFVSRRLHAAAAQGQALKLDRFAYGDKNLRLNAFQTDPGNLVVIFEDVTESTRAAEALRLSEEKFSTSFHTSPDAVNINRLSDGKYLDINEGFTRLVGYSREEAVGRTSLELNIWEDPEERARLVQKLRKTGEVQNMQARFRLKSGAVRQGLMSARVITIDGETCILSITRDIHDWIQAQEELRIVHANLERAYEATLEGWARALDLREHETADHSRRVVGLALEMASRLGIEGDALVHLRRGALLHDIGKLAVPDRILLKTEPLSPEEWAIMRQHPEFGAQLLSGIDHLQPCVVVPLYHHEKWDGSGYPAGLRGEQIPLAARIFTVADVYEALSSDRPYRPRWCEEEIRHYIREQSGRHFDPRVVDVFFQLPDRLDCMPKITTQV